MAMSSMNGHFGLVDYYGMDSTGEALVVKGSSTPFSVEGFKACPVYRSPMRIINRYSRIVRRSAIDEATKKFVSWSNAEFIKHGDVLHSIQEISWQSKTASTFTTVKILAKEQTLNYGGSQTI